MGNRKNLAVEVSSILVFALALFAVLSLLTFRANDASLFSTALEAPHNACGRVGAYFSSLILNGFGLGAFLFPASFVFVAANIHKKEGVVPVIGTLGTMAVAVSSLTVFLALQWKTWTFGGSQLLTGGIFGTWVSDALMQQLNFFGSSIVTFVIFSIAMVIATPVSIATWGGRILNALLIVTGRLCKVLGTYLLYLLGVAAMKTAGWAGEGVRNLIRATIKKTKNWEIQKQNSKSEKALTVMKSKMIPVDAIPVKGAHKNDSLIKTGLEHGADLPQGQDVDADMEATVAASFMNLPNQAPALNLDPDLSELGIEGDFEQVSPASSPRKNGEIKILPREMDAAAQAAKKGIKPPPLPKSKRGQWQLPTVEFLKNPPSIESTIDRERLIANSQILKQKFADFGIDGEVTAVRPGPVITLYEFKPGPGVKVSRIAALADDLSMALSAQSVRILAPLPGKSVVGIEIPSENRETVFLREFLQHPDFYGSRHMIPVVMGKDIGGQPYLSDLARMPHLLCAGQTGSGKSVFMNGLICSLFYRFTPDELRMILVDPKFIEFRAYQDIPHLLLPVVDDPKQASIALKWAVREMERRYRILAKVGARNLASFNQKVDELGPEGMRDMLFAEDNQTDTPSTSVSGGDWIEAFDPDENGTPRVGKLPYIVVIIDELADLMMIAKKEVEISIARIAQKARAAGIHLIIATQRPSTDVITGLIKANLPSRVSFQLASYVDSKTILDRAGAERLLGQGDMLFIPPGISQNLRLHGAYLDDDEINKITQFLKSQGKPAYRDEILLAEDEDAEGGDGGENEEDDALMSDGIELVKRSGHASASFLQRHLKIGYNRAARMIETMETRGIVGPQDGARPREVLIR
jgi:S-DNA-T family DNA segregation ATPase FtsK/SpoIIIE